MTDLHSTPADRTAVLGWPTPDHEADAAFALEKASGTARDDLALMPILADAQVHATLALVEQTAALVAAQTTANLIAWTTRPGFRPSGAHIDWIESQLGLKTEVEL